MTAVGADITALQRLAAKLETRTLREIGGLATPEQSLVEVRLTIAALQNIEGHVMEEISHRGAKTEASARRRRPA